MTRGSFSVDQTAPAFSALTHMVRSFVTLITRPKRPARVWRRADGTGRGEFHGKHGREEHWRKRTMVARWTPRYRVCSTFLM